MNKNYINSCLRWLANEIIPFYSNEKLPSTLRNKVDTFYESVSNAIDWYNLTKTDMLHLGFLNWEEHEHEDDTSGVWFIPAWLFYAIPEGITLTDKNNNQFTFYRNTAPTEVMYGCLTFGVTIDSPIFDEDI